MVPFRSCWTGNVWLTSALIAQCSTVKKTLA